MKLMHTADLHLDTPFVGMGKEFSLIQSHLLTSAMRSFEKIVTSAIEAGVDVFLIVGDVYNAQQQTISAQHFFMKQLKRLESAEIFVVFSHGNHDYLKNQAAVREYGKYVHIFQTDQVDHFEFTLKNGETVKIYGFSYQSQWIKERKIQEYPVNTQETDYVIGMLHGSMEALDSQAGNYAPFTIKELKEKNYDYWALGHIHKRQVLSESPVILYPGSIQGRHRHEDGPKGATIVTIQKGHPVHLQEIHTAPIQWEKINIECQYMMPLDQLIERLETSLDNYLIQARGEGKSFILDITLTHAERLDLTLQEQIQAGELMQALSIKLEDPYFALIGKIQLEKTITIEAFNYDPELQLSFKEAVDQLTQDPEHFQQVIAPLADHSIVHDYLKDIVNDPEFQKEAMTLGQDLVIQSLGFDMEEGDGDEI